MAEKIIKVYMTTDSRGSFDYIPDYKEYEKQRQENEKERKKYYNEIKFQVSNGEFDGATAYELALENGFEGTEEEWLRSLKGDKGDTGEKGDKGDTGDTGPQGPKPVKGEDYLTTDEVDTIVQEISKSVDNARVDARVDAIVPKNKANGTQQAYIEDALEYKVYDLKAEGNYKQDGTPTPDAPVEVEVIEGDVSYKAVGKNYFDISKVVSNSAVVNNNNGTLTINTSSNSSSVMADTPNTLKDYCPNLKVGDTVYLNATSTGKTKAIYLIRSKYTWAFKTPRTITQDDLDSIICWYANGINTTGTVSDIMISKEGGEYEPYKEPIIVPIDLKGNFVGKLSNGVADRLLYSFKDRHIYLGKNIRKGVLDGDVIGSADPLQAGLNYYSFNVNLDDLMTSSVCVCNKLEYSESSIFTNDIQGIKPTSSGALKIKIFDSSLTTFDLFKTWLSEHKPEVYYQLKTPELIDLGEYDLSTLEGINHVILSANLDPSNIEIEYALDLKKYTDKKINELTNALISTSANI